MKISGHLSCLDVKICFHFLQIFFLLSLNGINMYDFLISTNIDLIGIGHIATYCTVGTFDNMLPIHLIIDSDNTACDLQCTRK